MTEREQIAHLLRRFGLGAGKFELDRYAPLGLRGAIDRLIDYDKVDNKPDVSPWEFSFDTEGKANLAAPVFSNYWSFRFLTTKRPLEERLALFWHDHFAVSANKVEFGPMMLAYLQTIYKHASGNFRAFVHAMAKEPAMMEWLDLNTSNRFAPNENFAREVMELFTMGSGYTEKDIKEAARALTGWAILPTFLDQKKGTYEEQIKQSILQGTPTVLFITVPYLYDDGEKTILGKTGKFDGDQALDIMIERPETARYIVTKLWEWFAYPKPEPAIVDRLARVFLESKYEIKPVLRAIAASPEFYGDKCVRKSVKSPVDFTVCVLRSFDIRDILVSFRKKDAKVSSPIAKEIAGAAGYVTFTMSNQGLLLLYPPDVGGWNWGRSWVNSVTMAERIGAADLLVGNEKDARPLTEYIANRISKDFKPTSGPEVVLALMSIFDCELSEPQQAVLSTACEEHGGHAALAQPKSAARMLGATLRVLFAAPEFHLN
jgi:uncharacterized protein (DUF1800 family)